MNSTRRIVITGTDTGVGKTVLTALLLDYLRCAGIKALAMKPFCSGGREDALLLHSLQESALTLDEVNPFFFEAPVTPLVAARAEGRVISLDDVLARIAAVSAQCEVLLLEGAGGLLAPLGESYDLTNIIDRLGCEVVIAAANKLGAINHTRLTVHRIDLPPQRVRVALVEHGKRDAACVSNNEILQQMIAPVQVHLIPWLGTEALNLAGLRGAQKKVKKNLAGLVAGI